MNKKADHEPSGYEEELEAVIAESTTEENEEQETGNTEEAEDKEPEGDEPKEEPEAEKPEETGGTEDTKKPEETKKPEDSKDPKNQPKKDFNDLPRGAQRAINRAHRERKLAEERAQALEAELAKLRPQQDTDPALVQQVQLQQQQLQLRTGYAQQGYVNNFQKLLTPEEQNELTTKGDSISLERKPYTQLMLMEHPLGPRIAHTLATDDRLGDIFEAMDDRAALTFIQTLGNNVAATAAHKPKVQQPVKTVVNQKVAQAAPKSDSQQSASTRPSYLDMSDDELAKELGYR